MVSRNKPIEQMTRHQEQGMRSERLETLARLCATGEMPFPIGRPEDELKVLANLVRKQRRGRLLEFLAHHVAVDLRYGTPR